MAPADSQNLKPCNWWRKIPPGVWLIIAGLVVSRVILTSLGIQLYRGKILDTPPDKFAATQVSSYSWLNTWTPWDAGFYYYIATEWYEIKYPERLYSNRKIAFFPVYPAAIRVVSHLTGHPYVVGVGLANIFLCGAMLLLYRLVQREDNEAVARQTVWWQLLFPAAFVFSGMFTESLYLLLVLGCFYSAYQRRWWLVGLLGALLTLTRPLGILIIAPLVVEYFRQSNWRLRAVRGDILWLGLAPLALAGWMFYQYQLFHEPLAFLKVQAGWGHQLADPLRQLWSGLTNSIIYYRVLAGYTIAIGLLLALIQRRLDWPMRVYAWLSLLVPLCLAVDSMPRYTLVIFPLAIGLARQRLSPGILWPVMLLLILLQLFLFILWPTRETFIL